MAKRLLLLNGVAIVCVILFHATGYGFTAMFSWPHRYREVVSPNYDEIGTLAYYGLRLVEQAVVFAIPAFLFVSGYFVSVLVDRTRRTLHLRAVGARIRHLAVPYLLWSGVFLLALGLEGRVYSVGRYLWLVLTGSSFPNYYYVPLLMQLYLLAPIIVLCARWNWRVLLAATGLLQVCVYLLQYVIVLGVTGPVATPLSLALPKWFFPVHLFWFTAGIVAGFNQPALRALLARTKPVLVPCLVILFVAGVAEWELLLRWSGGPWAENRATLVDGLYAGVAILSFLAFTEVELPFASTLVELGARSYGIFLVHGLVMEYASRGLYHLAPWILGHQALLQPTLIAVGLAVPLMLMAMMNRSPSRGLYGHVFG